MYVINGETCDKSIFNFFFKQGGVTFTGLKHNIAVGIMFIDAWLRGRVLYSVHHVMNVDIHVHVCVAH